MKVYTYNDKVLTNSANGKWLKEKEAGPIVVSPGTIRVKMPTGWTAADFGSGPPGIAFTDLGNDVWDCVVSSMVANWADYFHPYNISNNAIELIALNTTLDSSYATDMYTAISNSTSLTKLYPDNYIVSNLTNVSNMLAGCTNIESGIVGTYNKLAALSSQITNYADCFDRCGINTVTGAAELAQIPSDWK